MKYLLLISLIFASCSTISIDKIGGWETYNYENIVVAYRKANYSNKSSPSYEFIQGLAKEQSDAIHKAEKLLNKEIKYPIKIYLYNQDEDEVKSNPYGGRADYQQDRIVYSYNESDVYRNNGERHHIGYHEMAHVIFGNEFIKYGLEKNRLITEGVSVWFDDGYQLISVLSKRTKAKTTFKKSLDSWISQYSGITPTLKQLIDEQSTMNPSLFYPLSGMFIKFVNEKYGFEVIQSLYDTYSSELSVEISKFFGKSIEEVDKEFQSYLIEYSNNNIPLYL